MLIEVKLFFFIVHRKMKRTGVPERLMPLLGMEGLLEQMKDHARIHIDKNIKNKQKNH